MALTLRLNPEDDQALTILSQIMGISKQQLAKEGVRLVIAEKMNDPKVQDAINTMVQKLALLVDGIRP